MGADFWPVIADAFVGILGVFVFILIGYTRPDPAVEDLRIELEKRLEEDKRAHLVVDYDTRDPAGVRIVYSAEALSFKDCAWDLPSDKAERIRSHLKVDLFKRQTVAEIRIEGHADRRSTARCGPVGPYHDNLQLSQNRARAVYNSLLGLDPLTPNGLEDVLAGISSVPAIPGLEYVRSLSQSGRVSVAGFGATRPFGKSRFPEDDPIHRRVELRIVFSAGH